MRKPHVIPESPHVIPEWGNRESTLTLACSSPKSQVNMDSR